MNQDSRLPFVENAGLMRKAADGDIEAFKRLYQRYDPLMNQFFIIRGADCNSADDLVQKIFTYLWEKRESFRGQASFETYLFSIARHILSKEIHQSHKIIEVISKIPAEFNGYSNKTLSQPEAECYFKELTDALEAAKTKLTDEQMQALEIAQTPDRDLHKVLEELGWSKESYKSHLKRARRRMRELFYPFFLDEKNEAKKAEIDKKTTFS